jgi:hypothetical protein
VVVAESLMGLAPALAGAMLPVVAVIAAGVAVIVWLSRIGRGE